MNVKLPLAVLFLSSAIPAPAAAWIAAADQAARRWVIFDSAAEPGCVWEWRPEQDARVKPCDYARFADPGEIRVLDTGKLLIACRGGAYAQIDVVTGKADFYGVDDSEGETVQVLPGQVLSRNHAVRVPYPAHMLPWLKVTEPAIPEARFSIVDFGARPDGTSCTAAFGAAMAAAAAAGGGRVVVPAGVWLTGKIHFRSGCGLHLAPGAVLEFSDDPADYLPSVPTSWEGVECYNYSPLLYGYGVTNVAITGQGLIRPRMDRWREWFGRSSAHRRATELLYHWCATNAPVANRDVTKLAGANVRPHLIQFNRCGNVLLDGFSIRESPFWMIHLLLSDNCIVRNLKTDCHGHNNDGVDIEMTRNVLVENCTFRQGDDGIVIKAGRNQDAWRLSTPTENVIVRDCDFRFAHTLLGVGSELSGGVRNVWMHDCRIGDCYNMFYLKTNRRRGGFVENVCGERLQAGKVKWAGVGIDTDVLYQWADFPDYELRRTAIRNIVLKDSACTEAGWAVRLRGDAHCPPENIRVEGLAVGRVEHADVVEHCRNVSVRLR